MAPSDEKALDDELLKRYLLGALPEAEAERLDELSVADEEFAGRLEGVENDLVDAYVRGELSEDNLKQFESFYLSSPKRRDKVRLAEGFLALERRAAAMPAGTKEAAGGSLRSQRALPDRLIWRFPAVPSFKFQWALAAACLALLVAGGYLLLRNIELRKRLTEAQSHQVNDQHARDLEIQLAQERSAREKALKELEQARASQLNIDQIKTVSVLLPPPVRGAGPIPTVSLRPGTDLVVLVLPLEADDFSAYQANLRDPATNRVLWSSTKLTAVLAGERKTVSVSFAARLLKQQNYIVDVKGIPRHGAAEVISGYPFRIVLQ